MFDKDHAFLMEIALPICAKYGLALAGGYAIKAHGLVVRPSDDVDFATASAVSTEEIVAALGNAYRDAGLRVEILPGDGRKGHLNVAFPAGRKHRVDLLKEALNFPPTTMSFGPVLSLRDAVALKMGALADRGLPRDMIDVHGATALFAEAELIAMARAVLGDEFSLAGLREQLDSVVMYEDEDFARYGCDLDLIAGIRAWAIAWSTRLGMEIVQDEPWSDEEIED